LWVANLETGNSQMLRPEALRPVWKSSEDTVAYMVATGGENWRYEELRLSDNRVRSFGLASPYYDGAYSPDGEVFVWVGRGEETLSVRRAGANSTRTDFSLPSRATGRPILSSDGRFCAVPAGDRVIVLDLEMTVVRSLAGHADIWRDSLAFSSEEPVLASADYRGNVRVWRLETPPHLALNAQRQPVWTLGLSSDERVLATGGDEPDVHVWSIDDGIHVRVLHHGGDVRTVRVRADGKQVASSVWDGGVYLWDLTSERDLPLVLHGHKGVVTGMRYSLDGSHVWTGDEAGLLRAWDTATGELISMFDEGSPVESIERGVISDCIAVRTLVDVLIHCPDREVIVLPAATASALALSPTARYAAWGSEEGQLSVIDLRDGRHAVASPHEGKVRDVSFSPDGTQIATAANDGFVILHDLFGRELTRLHGHENGVYSARFSPDGNRVVSAGRDGTVRIWYLHDESQSVLRGHAGYARLARFLSGGNILSVGEDGFVRIWSSPFIRVSPPGDDPMLDAFQEE